MCVFVCVKAKSSEAQIDDLFCKIKSMSTVTVVLFLNLWVKLQVGPYSRCLKKFEYES